MSEAEYEALLDNIEKVLSMSIDALDVAQTLFHADISTVYPDESIATAQCQDDLTEVVKSIQLRRDTAEPYQPSERVIELNQQFHSD
ncbi:hypothetical protein [Halopelagius inordinatus]|nr:hypothetical protein [Halopelagius inordinatus]